MKTNFHTHTSRCHHAIGTDEQYVKAAIEGGFDILGFSDHTPWHYDSDFVSDSRMLPSELPGYISSIQTLKEKYKGQIEIRIGLEVEYFPAYMPWIKELLQEHEIEYIIFGNHYYHSDETAKYFGQYTDSQYMLELYCESVIEGMETGLYSILAHPDLFMGCYPLFDNCCERISRSICKAAKRLHIPLEYNLGILPYVEQIGKQLFPDPHFWQIAKEEGCTAIIGVDAHQPERLSDTQYYDAGVKTLQELGIPRIDMPKMFSPVY